MKQKREGIFTNKYKCIYVFFILADILTDQVSQTIDPHYLRRKFKENQNSILQRIPENVSLKIIKGFVLQNPGGKQNVLDR